jgi:hypothetical protein
MSHAGSAAHPSSRASHPNSDGGQKLPHARHRQPISDTRSAALDTDSSEPVVRWTCRAPHRGHGIGRNTRTGGVSRFYGAGGGAME